MEGEHLLSLDDEFAFLLVADGMADVFQAADDARRFGLGDALADWKAHFWCCHYPAPQKTPDALACGLYDQVCPDNPFKLLRGEVR
jgi:hypothetical protein